MFCRNLMAGAALWAALVSFSHPAWAQSNGVLREVYAISGGSLSELTNNPAFPASPNAEFIDANFEAPSDWSDYYGQRVRALLLPPVTGQYTFWIASDDQSALFLSTDEDPAHKVRIAWVGGWTSSREWNKETNQKSGLITLTNGRRYYIEALQAEGSGGDNLAVTWQKPGGSVPANGAAPIPGANLVPYGLAAPMISVQPANTTVTEGGLGTFTVRLQRFIGATFQWFRNGTNVPGGTNFSLSLGPLVLSDSGSTFRCFVANSLGTTNSATATLTVLPDTNRPTITGVGNLGELTVLSVLFSEAVEPASATNASNYTINGGAVVVVRAVFGPDARTVLLTTTPLAPNSTNTLAVSGVRDRAQTPNTILPNSSATFVLMPQPLDVSYLKPAFEPPGPSSRRHGVVISEVMYHPTNRADGKNLEFIEVFNSQPWFEEVGGWRISGAVDFTFPSNTVLQPRTYRVIAANPAEFTSVRTNVPGVLGPFEGTNNLPNDSGTLRLRNVQDAVLFEMTYSGEPPWPAAADGAGHSLVLARPSFGERDPRAWDASDLVGGTPGTNDTQTSFSQRTILINEILAHTDPPQVDYVELYNYSASVSVNLSGCVLTDDPATNKFVITNLVLRPRSFVAFTEEQLGFALSADGETIFLKNPNGTRVIDALRFGPQENGVTLGRCPDGAPLFSRLLTPTPGTNNSAFKPADVVLNEIMYDPISGDSAEEYVELFNRGTNAVNLGGWRLEDAVQFTFPPGTTIEPGGYVVIGKDVVRLRSLHVTLTTATVFGNYNGALANGGERLALSKPDFDVTTNWLGQLVTNTAHVVVDEVTYRDGGRWGQWANGGGSSLELRDARADRRLAPNWADSDESAKSPWVNVEFAGVMDNGYADANQLHITLLGPGEALLDNVEVIPSGGANQIANGTFESGATGWVFQGNHNATSWEPGEGFNSSASLHLRAAGRGDTGANRVRVQLSSTLASGTTVTLRAKARWLKGNPCLLLRLRGNWLEAPGYILSARNLGTPGAPNSRAAANVGPAITEVRHWPALPAANAPVLVTAMVNDPDGLAFLALNYRIDPNTNYSVVPMTNNGAGLYSAIIPAQASGIGAAFFIQALDNFTPPASSRFPDDAPIRECVVRWGDTTIPGTLGTYRMWISQTNVSRWAAEEKMSNNPKDFTFLYGTNRVIYNAAGMFHGSPYHSPSYNSPVGNGCDYDLIFPRDDRLLGGTDINLFRPGNGGGDGTAQAELHGYWFAAQFGLPFLYHRPVVVFANGLRRETAFLDAQQPNGDFVEQWYPDDPDGDLHKVQLGFEFGDLAYGNGEPGYTAVGANLARYTTVGGVKKQARYRQTWPRRAAPVQDLNDYTNIFNLVEVALTNAAAEAYTRALTNAVDVEEWFRGHVVQHLYNNYDSYSYGGSQNAFAYKPERDTWKLFIWDNDFAFGGAANDSQVFNIGGADHGPRNDHPPFARIYWQALIDAVNGMMTAARSNPILDSRYNGMVAGGAAVGSPQGIKDFIAARRTYLLSVIASNRPPFRITSNGGLDLATNRNVVILTGTAPLEARSILMNGLPLTLTWTSLSNWTARVLLPEAGTNLLRFTATDLRGSPVASVSNTLRINFTGAVEPPQRVVLNEVHYHPAVPDTSFLEVLNSATNTAFDLSGWRIDGAGYAFLSGTFVEPGQIMVVAADALAFRTAFSSVTNLVGEFTGQLDNGGETLRLVKPGATPALDEVIDSVTYDDVPPWPTSADGGGFSLQLIDPWQDHQRVANWFGGFNDAVGWRLQSTNALMTGTNLYIWLDGAGDVFLDDLSLVPASGPLAGVNVLTNGSFESDFSLGWTVLGTNLTNSVIATNQAHSGQASLHVVATGLGSTSRTIAQRLPAEASNTVCALSYWYRLGSSGTNLTVRTHPGSAMNTRVSLQPAANVVRTTPGTNNSVRAALPPFPPVWLNEIQPLNLTGPVDGLGHRHPWVELFNSSTNPVSLGGFLLGTNYDLPPAWAFPSNAVLGGGQFMLVWLDGHPEESTATELHTSFTVPPAAGALALFVTNTLGGLTLLDYLNYDVPSAGRSCGNFPDGDPGGRQLFSIVTPGTTNNATGAALTVFINEWMADNASFLADPADSDYEDWFELFNPGEEPVDLSGYYLTDNLANPTQDRIPAGISIPAHGHLLVWADGETSQNAPGRALHVNFQLGKSGEAIGLFGGGGVLVDAVTFGSQTSDHSQGRFPDGGSAIQDLRPPTPGAANAIPQSNHAPVLAPIASQTNHLGATFRFTATATDADVPTNQLLFSLSADAPANAVIDAGSGEFAWTPTAAQAPSTNAFLVQVTDDGVPSLTGTTPVTLVVTAPLRFSAAAQTNGAVTLSWPAVAGRAYQVQFKTNLADAAWNNLGAPIPASAGTLTIDDNVSGVGQRFYRVASQP
ncbi:MAG: lamin tail domain-containing protein [Verrucomicrobia bacterium]|nr:lamin tail domain-containing protein [Verrucomicrobiota bacterium]